MSTPVEENTVVEPVVPASPQSVLPESTVAALPKVSADFDVDKFFPKEGEKPAAAPVKPAAVSADDAPPVAPQTLAAKLAAKSKPATPEAKVAPEAKPADPVAVEHPEDKMELDAKASVATRENFKNLKGVTKTLRGSLQAQEAKVAELQAKLEAASKAPSATEAAELAKLREESKALSDRLLLIDTKNHPKFKAQFEEPKNAAISAAKELLGDKASGVSKLLDLPRAELGKALSELTKDLNDLDRRDVTDSLYKAWQLEQAGRDALAKAGETHSAIRSKDMQEQKARFGERFEKIIPSLAEHLVKLDVPANATAQQRQSIEDYNSGVTKIRENAEKLALGTIDEDSIVSASAKAAAYDFHIAQVMPRIAQEVSEMQEVIAGLQKELALYHGKNPKRDIGASLVDSHAPAKAQSIEELADQHFK